VSETLKVDVVQRMLERLPGVVFCSRTDPVTGKAAWLYINDRAEEVYGVPRAEILADPWAVAQRSLPEDRARVEAIVAECKRSGAPMHYVGRVRRPDGEIRWLETHAKVEIEADGGILWYGQTIDVTDRKQLEQSLAETEAEKAALIERLRRSIEDLSTPILEVWDDVLVMPIIGVVDSRRTADMVQRLLAEVTRSQASFVIIDLTGVEIVDTVTADNLMKLMRKVEIVGARCVLTGIRSAVAETLVDLGVDFGHLVTLRNLKHGLREALRHARRDREGLREPDLEDDTDAEPCLPPAGWQPAPKRRPR
jgi:rsbT co-antagonist protein RsbR